MAGENKVGMNLVIADPKTGKCYKKDTAEPVFLNKRLGEEVSLETVGMPGYKAKITGGSDKDGFPMKPTLQGIARQKALIGKGVGVREVAPGTRKRITVRGNVVADDIRQVNLKITVYGGTPLKEIFPNAEPEAKGKEKKE